MGFGNLVISNIQEFEKVCIELGDSIGQYNSHVMSLEYPLYPSNIGPKKKEKGKNCIEQGS